MHCSGAAARTEKRKSQPCVQNRGLILVIKRLGSFQRTVMGSDVPAPTHAHSPSVDMGRAQPAEGKGIDARICSYARAKHTPKLLGRLSRIHAAKGQDCVNVHPRTHTLLVGCSVGTNNLPEFMLPIFTFFN